MRKSLFTIALLMAIAFSTTASAVQHAGTAWNQFAALYDFGTYPQSPGTRFRDAYTGGDFNVDFAALVQQVSQTLGVSSPDLGGDDLLNASLENWPDRSGL